MKREGSQALMPREHGAFAQLGLPLITGLALGGLSIPALAFAFAAVSLFFAHEPAAVFLGIRGVRLERTLAAAARRRAAVLVLFGVLLGALAMVTAPPAARVAALVPALGALVLLPVAIAGRLKQLGSELVASATFAAMLFPVAASGGVDQSRWLQAGVVWFVSFGLATLGVHAIKSRIKPESRERWTLIAAPILVVLVLGDATTLAFTGRVTWPVALAVFPPAVVTMLAVLLKVHPRQLRVIGWSLVASNVLTLGLILLG